MILHLFNPILYDSVLLDIRLQSSILLWDLELGLELGLEMELELQL